MTHEELDAIQSRICYYEVKPHKFQPFTMAVADKEDIDALITAARAAISKPITDAPKDGTVILGWREEWGEWVTCYYNANVGRWFEKYSVEPCYEPELFIPVRRAEKN